MQYFNLNALNLDIHIFLEVLAIIIALLGIIQFFLVRFKIIPNLRNNLINSKELSDAKEQILNLTTKIQEIEDNLPKYIEISDTDLINIYNNYPEFWLNTIEVSETAESYKYHHQKNNDAIVLTKVDVGKGYYWVLTGKDSSYLVPKKGIEINLSNYEVIEALFICHDYQSEYSNIFELRKPAKVSAISQGNFWLLEEKGELQMISHETASEPQLVLVYNNSPLSLLEQAIEVSQRGDYHQLILERVRTDRGSFWVLNRENEFYLVPKPNIRLNPFNYQLLTSLFICKDYQEGKPQKFKLIKPGKLVIKVQGETWELKEKGELQF